MKYYSLVWRGHQYLGGVVQNCDGSRQDVYDGLAWSTDSTSVSICRCWCLFRKENKDQNLQVVCASFSSVYVRHNVNDEVVDAMKISTFAES